MVVGGGDIEGCYWPSSGNARQSAPADLRAPQAGGSCARYLYICCENREKQERKRDDKRAPLVAGRKHYSLRGGTRKRYRLKMLTRCLVFPPLLVRVILRFLFSILLPFPSFIPTLRWQKYLLISLYTHLNNNGLCYITIQRSQIKSANKNSDKEKKMAEYEGIETPS